MILETNVEIIVTTRSESGKLGSIHNDAIEKEISVTKKRERQTYQEWTPSDRFKIGKYAAVNGNIASVCKCQAEFPHLNESTVREFKKKYNTEIANAVKEKREVANVNPKYSSQTGRPLLLGELDSMVQTYIKQLSNHGATVNRAICKCYSTSPFDTLS